MPFQDLGYWNGRTTGIPLRDFKNSIKKIKLTAVVKEGNLSDTFTELIKCFLSFFNKLRIHIAL